MGNSSTKESRHPSPPGHHHNRHDGSSRNPASSSAAAGSHAGHHHGSDRSAAQLYSSRNGRGSRPDLSFLGISSREERETSSVETRRETKAEREARKLEKERVARERERVRSMREEGVDGGYLVTLGTYTGPEDFSKPMVRQLMIERRLAPFWKGLNDHSDTWTEHQLVSAAQGLPIPPADEIPPEEPKTPAVKSEQSPGASDVNLNSLTVPIVGRSISSTSDRSANLSPSHPAFSFPNPSSPISQSPPSSAPFFRNRAKTLASLTSSSRNNSQTDMMPQEIQLPKDQHVNGMRIEAFLYKDASECPICFLYYPPHLNRTRCCDQPICSECFVQIKRPDPHPPEHHDDPNNQATSTSEQPEDNLLVSEPAACPFCKQPEFGVTYEPPPFRRGLVYAHQSSHPLAHATSAMSSSSSLNSQGIGGAPPASRRRTTSLSATASQVITTDKVRPDWAKKLADARAHALRRAAAATALHNAAYVLGNAGPSEGRPLPFGRRRRTMFGESPTSSGRGTPRQGEPPTLNSVGALMAAAERQTSGDRPPEGPGDIFPGRHSSRRSRIEDLEELMMMEAIRLSLAAEEERKRKEEKENAKEAKKEEKKKAKEAKKAEKAAKKSGMQSSSTLSLDTGASSSTAAPPAGSAGKGKAIDRSGAGFNPLNDPTSTLNTQTSGADVSPQQSSSLVAGHSENTSADRLAPPTLPLRHASSSTSLSESIAESLRNTEADLDAAESSHKRSANPAGLQLPTKDVEVPLASPNSYRTETPPSTSEPMFNFRSLAAMVGEEDREDNSSAHVVDSAGSVSADPPNVSEKETAQAPRDGDTASDEPVVQSANKSPNADGEVPAAAPTPDDTAVAAGAQDKPERGMYESKGHNSSISVVAEGDIEAPSHPSPSPQAIQ